MRIIWHEVFFRLYAPLVLEVNKILFIDYLGLLLVDMIKTNGSPSPIYTLWESYSLSMYTCLRSHLQVFLIIVLQFAYKRAS